MISPSSYSEVPREAIANLKGDVQEDTIGTAVGCVIDTRRHLGPFADFQALRSRYDHLGEDR